MAQRYIVLVQSWGPGGFNGDDPTLWAAPVYFNAGGDPPQAPQNIIVTPNQGRPTITWDDDPNAQYFHLYIGIPAEEVTVYFEWLEKAALPSLCNGTTCAITPDIDPVAGQYDVYMEAWGRGGYSAGGTVGSWNGPELLDLSMFTSTPEATNLNVSGLDTPQPIFTWDGVAGATWYQVWVGKLEPETTTDYLEWHLAADLGCENTGLCTFTSDEMILPNGEYHWYVQAWGPGGFSEWVTGTVFEIQH